MTNFSHISSFGELFRSLPKSLAQVLAVCGLGLLAPSYSFAQSAEFLVHEASGMCVDVSGAPGTVNGATLQLWACETRGNRDNGSATDHKWSYQNGFVRNGLSGKCMDVPGAPGTAPGSRMQIWDCELSGKNSNGSQSDQQFDFVNGQLRNRISGLCVGPARSEYQKNGQPLVLQKCTKPGTADLEFAFRKPAGAPPAASTPIPAPSAPGVVAAGKLFYLSEEGSLCVGLVKGKIEPNVDVALARCNSPQALRISYDAGAGKLRLTSRPSLCVDINLLPDGSAFLMVRHCTDDSTTKWRVDTNSDKVRNQDNWCWDVPGAKFVQGQVMVAAKCSNRISQKFVLND
jgi:hypothetical protein